MAHGKILGHVETPTFLHARSHCLKASTLGCYLYFNPRMYIIAWNFWGSMQMAHGKNWQGACSNAYIFACALTLPEGSHALLLALVIGWCPKSHGKICGGMRFSHGKSDSGPVQTPTFLHARKHFLLAKKIAMETFLQSHRPHVCQAFLRHVWAL